MKRFFRWLWRWLRGTPSPTLVNEERKRLVAEAEGRARRGLAPHEPEYVRRDDD